MISKSALTLFTIFLMFLHAGSIIAFTHFFSWKLFFISLILWQFFSTIGISVCYHRQISHRAFKTNRIVKNFHLFCAFLSAQAGPVVWSHVHRIHHKYSDQEKDPHSPIDGFWFGHLGWIFNQSKRANTEEFFTKPKDLVNDPDVIFFQRMHYPGLIVFFYFLYYIGGYEYLVWFGCFRITLTLHSAWAINSLGHLFGYRNFETKDQSKNSKLLAFVTAGEGFHNNHHNSPGKVKMSVKSDEFDLGYAYVKLLSKLNLAYDLRL